ncbi:MAG TPA: hypothetical protein VFE51_22230 [Verrucomicrobiae bacterium]|nr:hypothetical protein [Verrucomicrobiae bacterium]
MSPSAGRLLVEEIVPRIRVSVLADSIFVGADDCEELIQDATATAATLHVRLRHAPNHPA